MQWRVGTALPKAIAFFIMEKLAKVENPKVPGLQVMATLIKRSKCKALYLRDDNIYEVFRIKKGKAAEIFGKEYPEREVYPGSEDLTTACGGICTRNLEDALNTFNYLSDEYV